MLTHYMFEFNYPDTGLAAAVYEDGNLPDGSNPLDYAEVVWNKLTEEQPRLHNVPYDTVHKYIRSADGLYIQADE